MRKALAIFLILLIPVGASAGIESGDLPPGSTWYLHIDFNEMRSSDAGKGIYEWLNDEVIEEVNEETGIDLYSELDRLTAYSAGEGGAVMVMEGGFSQDTYDKLMALAATADEFDQLESRGSIYYFVRGGDDDHDADIQIDGIDDAAYFSFAIDNRIIMTGSEEQMQELLANGGRIAGQGGHDGALFVLTAERSFVQAGMDTDDFDHEDNGFDSNILQNTKEVALMIADVAGNIAIEAQLITTEAEVADSLASIVRGLIALQIFTDDMKPEVAEVLRSTRVDVDDNALKIRVTLSPEAVTAALEEA